MDPALLGEVLSLLMFATACGLLLLGFPVAFTLGGTALMFFGIGYGLDMVRLSELGALPNRYFGVMTNYVLVAVPLLCHRRSGGMEHGHRKAPDVGLVGAASRGNLGDRVLFRHRAVPPVARRADAQAIGHRRSHSAPAVRSGIPQRGETATRPSSRRIRRAASPTMDVKVG
jgi:hypothetical protein